MTTLAARVLEAIEAAEVLVAARHEYIDHMPVDDSWHTSRCGWRVGEFNGECECGVPAAVLRRCAADRRVLARHESIQENVFGKWICTSCDTSEVGSPASVLAPCDDLRDLAWALGVPLEQEET